MVKGRAKVTCSLYDIQASVWRMSDIDIPSQSPLQHPQGKDRPLTGYMAASFDKKELQTLLWFVIRQLVVLVSTPVKGGGSSCFTYIYFFFTVNESCNFLLMHISHKDLQHPTENCLITPLRPVTFRPSSHPSQITTSGDETAFRPHAKPWQPLISRQIQRR